MLSFYIRQTKHQFVWWIFATCNIHFINYEKTFSSPRIPLADGISIM